MHRFEYFKGFLNTELDLFKPFTILIGPNGSGKSNVIEAIELLAFIVHGGAIHDIAETGKGYGQEIRGGLQSCSRHGVNVFSFAFLGWIQFEGRSQNFSYKIAIQTKPSQQIAEEAFFVGDKMIFESVQKKQSIASSDILVSYNNFARGGRKPKVSVSATKSVISQYREFAENNRKYKGCLAVISSIMNYLHASFVFDPEPKLMRQYERISNRVLAKNGANISAVLYALQQGNKEEQETLARLLERIKQLPDEPYQNFGFITTADGDVLLALKEGREQHPVSAKLLSDGTLRSLAVLTALETVNPSSRIVIEEFDNGLHPSRVKIVTEAIRECCERRKLNVFVTTHNPATLNALQPEQLDGVVNCVYNDEEQAAKLVPLSELPRYVEFMERGQLGDLVTRRVLEQYLAPNFEENRQRDVLKWLENLP